jgi:beta-aspartyl-peptidase (threonine type)
VAAGTVMTDVQETGQRVVCLRGNSMPRRRIINVTKIVCASVLLATTGAAATRQKKSGEPSAAREIRAVLDRQVQAWNRRDLEGFMQGYWHSPDLTFYSGGTVVSGWESTLDRYRKRYQSEGNEMGKLDFSELRIELLGPSAAFVRGRFHLKMSGSEPAGIFTLTFRKFAGGWKIIHDHTSTP